MRAVFQRRLGSVPQPIEQLPSTCKAELTTGRTAERPSFHTSCGRRRRRWKPARLLTMIVVTMTSGIRTLIPRTFRIAKGERGTPASAGRVRIRNALSLFLWAATAACGQAGGQRPPADYVALGSSFAAGPGVGGRVHGAPILCARSDANYARQLAGSLHLRLRDMTCSGATIANLLTTRQAGQAPQIDGVDAGVRLVTITVGGNDVAYLGNLAGESCANDPSKVPLLWRPIVCRTTSSAEVGQAFAELPSRLGGLIDEVRKRAPAARIVLVDYATVLPTSGSCYGIAPLHADQIRDANLKAVRLSAITERVAVSKHALFVSASRVTRGHDVCSRDPWVFGFVFNRIPLTWGPFAFHPNQKGMLATADAISSLLRTADHPDVGPFS